MSDWGSGCSPACGWCGACTAGPARATLIACDRCGAPLVADKDTPLRAWCMDCLRAEAPPPRRTWCRTHLISPRDGRVRVVYLSDDPRLAPGVTVRLRHHERWRVVRVEAPVASEKVVIWDLEFPLAVGV